MLFRPRPILTSASALASGPETAVTAKPRSIPTRLQIPENLSETVLTSQGSFDKNLGEFILNYDQVRRSPDPPQAVLNFLESTYSAAADAAKWDRANLDRHDGIAAAAVHLQ